MIRIAICDDEAKELGHRQGDGSCENEITIRSTAADGKKYTQIIIH